MREIKFRVWDGNRFYRFDDSRFVLSYCDVSGWNVHPNITNFKGMWTCGESASNAEHFVLEQYTGLCDKNGVEIYEGDVVMVRSQYETDEPIECQSKVFSADGSFRCDFHDMVLNKNLCAGIGNWSIEVIGNIHENPELMEANHEHS